MKFIPSLVALCVLCSDRERAANNAAYSTNAAGACCSASASDSTNSRCQRQRHAQ